MGRCLLTLSVLQMKIGLTLSDMALAGCAPAWGGAKLARMLDFLARGLNQSFQRVPGFIILQDDIVDHFEK